MAIVHFPLKLVSRRMIAPTVAHLSFLRDDGQPLDYIPGQFIQVHFSYADGTPARRSYSLATQHDHALGAGEAVEIAVSYVAGGAATALFEGQRRYFDIHYYLEGEETVEWAAKSELQVEQVYDDTTDREGLAGEVRVGQKVGNGQVVIFENDEAYRFVGDGPVRKVIIKVTVEGGYFKNK